MADRRFSLLNHTHDLQDLQGLDDPASNSLLVFNAGSPEGAAWDNSLDMTISGTWQFDGLLRAWTDTDNTDVFHTRNNSGTADLYFHWGGSNLHLYTESGAGGSHVCSFNSDGSASFYNGINITSTGDARLNLIADTDNLNEDDNPAVYFEQDGGARFASIGLNETDKDALGNVMLGAAQNSLTFHNNIAAGAVEGFNFGSNGQTHININPDGNTSLVLDNQVLSFGASNGLQLYASGGQALLKAGTMHRAFVADGERFRIEADRALCWNPLLILESATHATVSAGFGQLWIKNTTPVQLWFTDDVGTDTRIV